MSATAVRPIAGSKYGPVPDRSLEQRMEALKRANDVRHHRAELKRDLKARRVGVAGLLLNPPEFTASMKVFDVLLATPKVGRVKCNKLLGQCRISPSKTIGGLTDRQREELAGLLIGAPVRRLATPPRPVSVPVDDYLREPLR